MYVYIYIYIHKEHQETLGQRTSQIPGMIYLPGIIDGQHEWEIPTIMGTCRLESIGNPKTDRHLI